MNSIRFIDNNAPLATTDRATRKAIRSQAATGKNVGRRINRPSRAAALREQLRQRQGPWGTQGKVAADAAAAGGPGLPEGRGRSSRAQPRCLEVPVSTDIVLEARLPTPGMPFRKWALGTGSEEMTRTAIAFFFNIRYTPELRSGLYISAKSPPIWLQLVFSDEAYFHIAVAASTMIFSQSTRNHQSLATSMKHLSRAFQLINAKLTASEEGAAGGPATDALMAVVIFMALYERHQGRWMQGFVHLRGLQRMVELRGGLAGLIRDSPAVAHKILRLNERMSLADMQCRRRLDLEYALHTGNDGADNNGRGRDSLTADSYSNHGGQGSTMNTTRFGIERIVQVTPSLPDILVLKSAATSPPKLLNILHNAMLTSERLNTACSGTAPKVNGDEFRQTLEIIGYDLVRLRPLGARPWAVEQVHAAQDAQLPAGSPALLTSARPAESPLIQDLLHIGLYTWLLRFFHRLDGVVEEVPRLVELVQRAADAILGPASTTEAGAEAATDQSTTQDKQGELVLWMLFLAGSLQFQRRPYKQWLLVRIRQALQRLRLDQRGWDATRQVIERYPWLQKLHGRVAEGFWNDAMQSSCSPEATCV
ncbi:hypothetical protein Micbo1qcDRAFT_197802 [Microdochium bolleyi]|uniref:Uncharacterized protein n=1 Tax=Microdochium bolleyi TaxID=196109 RepID=A0A136IRE7_9PEZI|nr:hypothetical protein Micbo1qcDRAFT_197802 [Microdochium bolleyi]